MSPADGPARPAARPTVGLVGAGNVGGRMAKDLVAAGYRVIVRDPAPEAATRARENGAEIAADLSALAAADVVLLSLPNSDTVDEVVAGDGGLLSLLPAGRLIVDMSTSLPSRTLRPVELGSKAVSA